MTLQEDYLTCLSESTGPPAPHKAPLGLYRPSDIWRPMVLEKGMFLNKP